MSNRTTLDINKVAYANYYYTNQYGDRAELLPTEPTLFGCVVDATDVIFGRAETKLEMAIRLKRIDIWKAKIVFQLSNSHSVTYTGEKAKSMHKAWRVHIFNK